MVNQKEEICTDIGKAMGTFLRITSYGRPQGEVSKAVRAYFRNVENLCSRFRSDSDVSRISAAAGVKPVMVSSLCRDVCRCSLREAVFTGGIFDPTVGALTSLWNIGGENERIPSEKEIEKAKVLIDYRHIEIGERSVFLKEKGMSLDLGGIAKEYALHQAAALAEHMGECSMMIDAGGDICVVGNKPDGSAWRLGIQHPRQRSTLIATVALGSEDTVETSGDYRRFLLKDGLMQSHIFQIKKKIPLISATLIYKRNGEMLPVSGAACIAGGLDKVREWLERIPWLEGIFITEDLQAYVTEGISDRVRILTKDADRRALIRHEYEGECHGSY